MKILPQGKLVYENGEIVAHRIWFKNIFNPFLRKHFNYHIITEVDDKNNIILGYKFKKYNDRRNTR